MQRLKQYFAQYDVWLVALFALIVSIISTAYYFNHHDILGIPDAISRVDIARRVVDFKQPGLQQIGGFWLPLPQILMIPFVAFHQLWYNGLAGSFVSMIAYVVSALYIYRIGKLLTGKIVPGLMAAAILMLNPNVLYLQSTPMAELTLLATILATSYYFIRWYRDRVMLDLVKSGIWVFLASLVRYEAWMVLVFCSAVILVEALIHRRLHKRLNGQFFLFVTLGAFAILLWILWSLVIFHNILYWYNGPFSAFTQQSVLATEGLLPTKHNLILSITTMIRTMNLDVGKVVLYAALIGLVALIGSAIFQKSKRNTVILISLIVLFAPGVMDIFSLYTGNITITPSLHNLAGNYQVRYGLASIPLIALIIALAIDEVINYAALKIIGGTLLVLSYALIPSITITLAVAVASTNINSRVVLDAKNAFTREYKGGNILAGSSTGSTIILVHAIGLPFKDYIQEGDSGLWQKTLNNPEKHAQYVILTKIGYVNPTPDDVYTDSYLTHKEQYQKYYDLVYNRNDYMIFALKSLHEQPVNSQFNQIQTSFSGNLKRTIPQTNSPLIANVVVTEGESESIIVRSEIHLLDPDHTLTSAQEAYVEGAMVQKLGNNNLIYPGQRVSLNVTQLESLITNSKDLSGSRLAMWQAYGLNIEY